MDFFQKNLSSINDQFKFVYFVFCINVYYWLKNSQMSAIKYKNILSANLEIDREYKICECLQVCILFILHYNSQKTLHISYNIFQNCFVPALLCALSHPEAFLRQVAVKLLAEVAKLRPLEPPNKSYHTLVVYLVQQSDEISQHEEYNNSKVN